MCSSAPATPDYVGAANATAAGSLAAARATAKLSNPNVLSPYGTQTVQYGINGDPDQATVTQVLSPEQQSLYNKNTQAKGLLADVGVTGAGALGDIIGQNVDFSGAPAAPTSANQTREDVVNAMMGRVNTDTANSKEQAQSDLIAAGIRPGTRAYDDKMALIDRGYNDARQQAITAGSQAAAQDFSMDSQARKDAISEILTQRQTPLNEINALMSGSQVTNPFAGSGYQAGATVQGPNYNQAAVNQGNAANQAYGLESANQNSLLSAGASLGAAYLGSSALSGLLALSDRRLKRNIRRIGTHPLGIGIYEFDYVWGEHSIGVMADEVKAVRPRAVVRVGDYDAVNYADLGA